MTNEIKKGDKVRIKKGTTIRSTKEGYGNPYQAGRTYNVKVFNVTGPVKYHVGHQMEDGRVIDGLFFADFENELRKRGLNTIEEAVELKDLHDLKFTFEESPFSKTKKDIYWETEPAMVEWAGSGGYWTQAKLSDVEKV